MTSSLGNKVINCMTEEGKSNINPYIVYVQPIVAAVQDTCYQSS